MLVFLYGKIWYNIIITKERIIEWKKKKELKLINNNNTNEKIKILNLYKFGFLLPAIITSYYIIRNMISGQVISWINLYLLIIPVPFILISLTMNIVIHSTKKEIKEPNNAIKYGNKITVELTKNIDHSKVITERNVDLIFKKDDKEYILKNFNDYNFTDEFLEITNDNEFIIYEHKDNYYIKEKEVFDKICEKLLSKGFNNNPIKRIKLDK